MKQNNNKSGRYIYAFMAAFLAFSLPLLYLGLAKGAASDLPPSSNSQNQIAAMPQNNMDGWVIPAPANVPPDPQAAAQIARGRYLVVAGDCLPCHSLPGEPPFSGGLAVGSPVGAIFSPNITPSKKNGIGNYTDQEFWNVLHNGIAPGSSLLVFPKYLYPSMPYDAYSKLSYPDVMAIKAYLDSLPPAEIPNRPGQIPFPLNTRAALLGWRILFFHPQPIQYDSSWNPSVRNGAFLVQALAHCSDCHTPRNLLFASENSKFLGGGQILAQSWYAPNISPSQHGGIGAWPAPTLINYLHNGGSLGPGAPIGPMQEAVQDSLSRLPQSDVEDIVAFLQTAVSAQPSAMPPATGNATGGAQIYADNCARCHGENGQGVANNFPNLAGNQSIWDGPANNLISMVLGGFAPWHKDQSAMPAYNQILSDTQIASLSNYIRTSWGNKAAADTTPAQVADLRQLVAVQVTLSTGTAQSDWQTAADVQQFDDISGGFSRDGNQVNCQLDAQLRQSAGPNIVHLAGACANGGGALQGHITVNGQTSPVMLRLTNIRIGNNGDGVAIYGPVGRNAKIDLRIALGAPNG